MHFLGGSVKCVFLYHRGKIRKIHLPPSVPPLSSKPPNPGKWILLLRDKAGMRVSLEGGNTPGAGDAKTRFCIRLKIYPGRALKKNAYFKCVAAVRVRAGSGVRG